MLGYVVVNELYFYAHLQMYAAVATLYFHTTKKYDSYGLWHKINDAVLATMQIKVIQISQIGTHLIAVLSRQRCFWQRIL